MYLHGLRGWRPLKRQTTDGGDDGDGVEQRSSKRPLQFRLRNIVVSVPAEILHSVENLILELEKDGANLSRVSSVHPGQGGRRRGPAASATVAQLRRQPPDLVNAALPHRPDAVLGALLGRRLDRLEEEAAHDGVGDHHGGESDVRE